MAVKSRCRKYIYTAWLNSYSSIALVELSDRMCFE